MMNGMNRLRLGGLNSGLDTEAIVRAMSGATRLRINNNRRRVLMLQAQQNAYRDVITRLQNFQSTYFNVLNTNNFLRGSSIFNRAGTTVFTRANGAETAGAPAGVTVTSSVGAASGSYVVRLLESAKQATLNGGNFASNPAIDMSTFTGAPAGSHFALSVSLGSGDSAVNRSLVIDIRAGEAAQDAINRVLRDTFGTSNTPGQGLVSVDASGRISSTDSRPISLTNVIEMSDSQILTFSALGLNSGNNSFNIQIGDEMREVAFRTVNSDYFNIFFDSSNNFVTGAAVEAHIDQIAQTRFENRRDAAYADWNTAATTTPSVRQDMRDRAFNITFNRTIDNHIQSHIDTQWTVAYAGDNTLDREEWEAKWRTDNADTITNMRNIFRTANEATHRTNFMNNTNVEQSFGIVYGDNRFTSYDWVRESAQAEYDQRLAEFENQILGSAYNDWLANPATTQTVKDQLFDTYFQHRLNQQQITQFESAKRTAYNEYVSGLGSGVTPTPFESWDWGANGGFSNWQDWRQDKINSATAASNTENWDRFYTDERNRAFDTARRDAYDAYVTAAGSGAQPPSFENWNWRDAGNNIITRENWTGFAYADATALRTATLAGANPFIGTGDGRQVNPNMPELYDRFLRSARIDGGTSGIEAGRLDREMFRSVGYNEAQAYNHVHGSSMPTLTAADAVRRFNEESLKNAIESLRFPDDTRVEVTFSGGNATINAVKVDANGVRTDPVIPMGITFNEHSANRNENGTNAFNIANEFKLNAATVNVNSTLAQLGIDFPSGSNAISINGVNINVNAGMTVTEMMNAVNASAAGVTMTFSALTNSFTIIAKEHGSEGKIDFGSDTFTRSLMQSLRLDRATQSDVTFEAGTNLALNVSTNGGTTFTRVETTGDSHTINGTTFKFESHVAVGTEIRVEVGKDTSVAFEAIKNFVNDYNKLIADIFGMLNERPNRSYHFLTDEDMDEFGMSDRQIEQWENMARRGLLFGNSSVRSVMSGMRMAMLTTVRGKDGKDFGFFNIRGNADSGRLGAVAIQPSNDFRENGKLILNEEALKEALDRNPEDIMNLFSGENGIMANLQRELDRAIRTTGGPSQRGILISRAGTTTAATTDNAIFNRIKSLNDNIDILQARYERQQDRFWRMFSNMEKQFASMNSQSTFVTGMFNNMNMNNQQR
jgi:flagellar capping protein FliD